MEEKCGNEKEKGQYTVQKIVAVLLIVVQGFKKCEKNNDKYLQLKSHQKMLKWVNKLLSHHKRIVRQTARKLLAIYSRLD